MTERADPVRDNVEAALHRLVGLASSGPCAVARAAGRTISESIGTLRSVLTLTVDGLLGWDVDAGVAPLVTGVVSSTSTTKPTTSSTANVAEEPDRAVNPRHAAARAAAAELAIPGYEDLAASHIVARLDKLTAAELTEIRAFEVANRGRRTVVGKIDQLLG